MAVVVLEKNQPKMVPQSFGRKRVMVADDYMYVGRILQYFQIRCDSFVMYMCNKMPVHASYIIYSLS